MYDTLEGFAFSSTDNPRGVDWRVRLRGIWGHPFARWDEPGEYSSAGLFLYLSCLVVRRVHCDGSLRPRSRGNGAHDSEPAYACLHPPAIFFEGFRIHLELDAKHQLFAFIRNFDSLGGELRRFWPKDRSISNLVAMNAC